MHIHAAQASALGNALAGAQDAETAVSMRRARELRDAALRLKAASFEINTNIPQDPETAAQTASMVNAWNGGSAYSSGQQSSGAQQQNAAPQLQQVQEVQRTPPDSPVSYWA